MAMDEKTVNPARGKIGRHICAFFHSRGDEYEVLLPFMREGFLEELRGRQAATTA